MCGLKKCTHPMGCTTRNYGNDGSLKEINYKRKVRGKTGIFQWVQWWGRLGMDQTKTFLEVNVA